MKRPISPDPQPGSSPATETTKKACLQPATNSPKEGSPASVPIVGADEACARKLNITCTYPQPVSVEDDDTYDLDPTGDIVIVLGDEDRLLPSDLAELTPEWLSNAKNRRDPDPTGDEEYREYQIRCSSKHLMLASKTFERQLPYFMDEIEKHGFVEIGLFDEPPRIFLLVLMIIHGRTRLLPRKIGLSTLAGVAELSHKLECEEAVNASAQLWISKFGKDLPRVYSKYARWWLQISWVFQGKYVFQKITKVIQATSTDAIEGNLLCVPDTIIDELNEARYRCIEHLISALQGLLKDLATGDNNSQWCTPTDPDSKHLCLSSVLGDLTTHMYSEGLLIPEPKRPYPGIGFGPLMERFVAKAEDSSYSCHGSEEPECRLLARITRLFKDIQQPLGLDINSSQLAGLEEDAEQ
ncbi:uncharacterized protein DSM5745_10389 [Aspergillus mulundensis]|uniref:BTB domain-containing protein n=1 Tax=Aspergillus mulundensis TaxID=1810919 RepID=A0A3D8QIZ7_9EURO|nr:hypothetical protein DSM5745_10389 [Aspergillus mulundensis]RDW61717.1 hypothetical protein DSM5745_10389 [Aspergillus mulundensis]